MAIESDPHQEPARPTSADRADAGLVDFFFDFVSPFGYFASLRIDALAAKYGYETRWHSMLIGVSVVKVMGMKPLLETPLKGPYIRHDANRYARRHKIVLGRSVDDPMADSRSAGKAFSWIDHHYPNRAREFAQRVFAAYWLHGNDISLQETIEFILEDMALGQQDILAGISSDEASGLLRANVSASLERGVFGSPFFIVHREPFFGVEKMELLEQWLASGGW